MKKANKPILITGSHRSGTTWVGENLTLAPRTRYIHEPFNIGEKISVINTVLNYWFEYICDENASQYKSAVDKVIYHQYPLFHNLAKASTIKDIAKIFRDQLITLKHKTKRNIPVVKDPIALFSAEWLSKEYEMHVLVMIRHPAAFCSSLKIKNWMFDFNNFLKQPLLMDKYLGEFKDEIHEFTKEKKPIIDQAILLWNCIHHTINIYQNNHQDWLFMKHEDLSNNPLKGFESIYKRFGLEFTPKVKLGILESSGSHNPKEQKIGSEFKRDSKANIKNWKKRLDTEEINNINTKTDKISRIFYGDDEW